MNWMSDHTVTRKQNICVEVRVECIHTALGLQSQFQDLCYFYFLIKFSFFDLFSCQKQSPEAFCKKSVLKMSQIL